MKNLIAIVLAAGKGTRMKSKMPKVMHKVSGLPMIYYPLKVLEDIKCSKSVCLIGFESKMVAEEISKLPLKTQPTFALQDKQLGTAHAAEVAFNAVKAKSNDDVLILSGDVPLIQKETIKKFIKEHNKNKNTVLSFITIELADPSGYGRVVRDDEGTLISITEDKDLNRSQKHIQEINTGIYIAKAEFLKKYLPKINNKNAQKEYYLTDLVALALADNLPVSTFEVTNEAEVHGINSREDLNLAQELMTEHIIKRHMKNGVTMKDSFTAYIDSNVKIGRDTVLEPNVYIYGDASIGGNCTIESGARITDSKIGDNCHIKANSNIESSVLKKNVTAGPFARLRPGTILKDDCHVGNFVEIKNSTLGEGSKAGHLTYIGDAVIGKNVNIGAGVITCNYDGVNKHITKIGDGAFIGSDSQLVAPVTVGKNAYVGSGSTITKDVPSGKLAVARAPQKTFTKKIQQKKKKK